MPSRILAPPPIIIDTREQLPYEFPNCPTKRGKLESGDYSLEGYVDRVAVERKTLADAYGCVGRGRERFERCLQRLSNLERPAIVIEASLKDMEDGLPRTKVTPAMAIGSYVSWACKYRIPVFFADDRKRGERITLRWLAAFWKHLKLANEARLTRKARGRRRRKQKPARDWLTEYDYEEGRRGTNSYGSDPDV